MTSQKPNVQVNDLIAVYSPSSCKHYKVLEISCYTNFPDMWIARMTEVHKQ